MTPPSQNLPETVCPKCGCSLILYGDRWLEGLCSKARCSMHCGWSGAVQLGPISIASEHAELVRKMTALREIIKGDMNDSQNTPRVNDLLLKYQTLISMLVGKDAT